jgi:hypothetical protein
MNRLVKVASPALNGDIVLPGATVRVVGKPHILSGDRIDRYLEVGLTIDEMISEALRERPEMAGRRDLHVHLDGHAIEEQNWRRVRAKPGTVVTFVPALGNGAELRTVLSVVVAVAAIALAGPLGGAFAETAFATGLGISATVASALVAGGILPAGGMATEALWPATNHME